MNLYNLYFVDIITIKTGTVVCILVYKFVQFINYKPESAEFAIRKYIPIFLPRQDLLRSNDFQFLAHTSTPRYFITRRKKIT